MKILKCIIPLAAVSLLTACNDRNTGTSMDREESDLGTVASEGSDVRVHADTNAVRVPQASEDVAPPPDAIAADNTGRNAGDPSVTPMDQGSSEADMAMTVRIRQALMESDALSLNAKNIKVITRNGQVTLRGPLDNAEEMQTINQILERMNVTTVYNELENVALKQ